jgi:hypothetical protein
MKVVCFKCDGSRSELGYQGNICPYCEGTGIETVKVKTPNTDQRIKMREMLNQIRYVDDLGFTSIGQCQVLQEGIRKGIKVVI